jgi:hypothetical protein
MKQGIIIYLLGGGEPPPGVELGTYYPRLSHQGDPLAVVVSQPGILELDDAWRLLSTLGCDPIHLSVTRAEPDRLHPLYPLVRLSGVARMEQDPPGAHLPGRVLH